jgi:hypothetical protein
MRMVAVVLAGGSGQRFGAAVPKQLLELDGQTLLEHCVGTFDAAPGVDEVLVVMPPGRTADAEKLRAGGAYPKVSGVIEGGTSRPGRPGRRSPRSGPGSRPPGTTWSGACCSTMRPARWSISASSPTVSPP